MLLTNLLMILTPHWPRLTRRLSSINWTWLLSRLKHHTALYTWFCAITIPAFKKWNLINSVVVSRNYYYNRLLYIVLFRTQCSTQYKIIHSIKNIKKLRDRQTQTVQSYTQCRYQAYWRRTMLTRQKLLFYKRQWWMIRYSFTAWWCRWACYVHSCATEMIPIKSYFLLFLVNLKVWCVNRELLIAELMILTSHWFLVAVV